MSSKYKLVIFDWDGTLMDSVPRIVHCMKSAARLSNIAEPSEEAVKEIIGLGLLLAIEQLFPEVDGETHQQVRQNYATTFKATDKMPSPLFDGVTDVLEQLSSVGCQMAVATGKSRAGLNRVMPGSGIEHHFDHSRCADETHSKPHPAMIEELMAVTSVSASETLMVGDSSFDLEMAQRASVDSVGVTYGAAELQKLRKYNPLRCIDSIQELLFIL